MTSALAETREFPRKRVIHDNQKTATVVINLDGTNEGHRGFVDPNKLRRELRLYRGLGPRFHGHHPHHHRH